MINVVLANQQKNRRITVVLANQQKNRRINVVVLANQYQYQCIKISVKFLEDGIGPH